MLVAYCEIFFLRNYTHMGLALRNYDNFTMTSTSLCDIMWINNGRLNIDIRQSVKIGVVLNLPIFFIEVVCR